MCGAVPEAHSFPVRVWMDGAQASRRYEVALRGDSAEVYIYGCGCACVRAFMYVYVVLKECRQLGIHTYVHTYIFISVSYTYIQTHIHTYIHTYIAGIGHSYERHVR